MRATATPRWGIRDERDATISSCVTMPDVSGSEPVVGMRDQQNIACALRHAHLCSLGPCHFGASVAITEYKKRHGERSAKEVGAGDAR